MNSLHWLAVVFFLLVVLAQLTQELWSLQGVYFQSVCAAALIAAEVVRNLKSKP